MTQPNVNPFNPLHTNWDFLFRRVGKGDYFTYYKHHFLTSCLGHLNHKLEFFVTIKIQEINVMPKGHITECRVQTPPSAHAILAQQQHEKFSLS
jgi:hypothetical protein